MGEAGKPQRFVERIDSLAALQPSGAGERRVRLGVHPVIGRGGPARGQANGAGTLLLLEHLRSDVNAEHTTALGVRGDARATAGTAEAGGDGDRFSQRIEQRSADYQRLVGFANHLKELAGLGRDFYALRLTRAQLQCDRAGCIEGRKPSEPEEQQPSERHYYDANSAMRHTGRLKR